MITYTNIGDFKKLVISESVMNSIKKNIMPEENDLVPKGSKWGKYGHSLLSSKYMTPYPEFFLKMVSKISLFPLVS